MERRRKPRTRKRIACRIECEGRDHSGIVLDISDRGLFVQTQMAPRVGLAVKVALTLSGGEEIVLEATIARARRVPPQLMQVARGGLGLRIEHPPRAYLDFVAGIEASREG